MSAAVAALVKDVEQARQRVLDAVADVSSAQGAWKPALEERTIAECLEHLCLAEQNGVNGMCVARPRLFGPVAYPRA
jgi:hypothetical protein